MKSKTPTELELIAQECVRLGRCEKLQDDELLDGALNGAAKTVDSVTRLMEFIAKHMPPGNPSAPYANAVAMEARAFDRWWRICSDYLLESGVAEDQMPQKPPAPGESGFVSVLDEFEAGGPPRPHWVPVTLSPVKE